MPASSTGGAKDQLCAHVKIYVYAVSSEMTHIFVMSHAQRCQKCMTNAQTVPP